MNFYIDKKYDMDYKIQDTNDFAKEILIWQDRIKQIDSSNTINGVLEENRKLVSKHDKEKYDNFDDLKDKKKVLINHHTNEIQKIITRRTEYVIGQLHRKGLYTVNVDDVRFPINHNWKNVLVMLSGGADSACLTYILCKIIQEKKLKIKINVVSGIRVWKSRPWAADVSEDVYNWLKKAFPKIIGKRHTIFVPTYFEHSNLGNAFDGRPGEAIVLSEYVEYLCNTLGYDAVYNATTQNPTNYEGDRMEGRDASNAEILCSAHEKYWKLGPLKTTTKKWVIKQYKKYNILDLLRTTRSCEGDAYLVDTMYGLDWQWYEKGKEVPECGKCFWCKEKEWALKENKIEF